MRFWVICFTAFLSFASQASAERWLVLEPVGEARVPPGALAQTDALVEGDLDRAGIVVVRSDGDVACRERSCIPDVLARHEADAAVVVSLWTNGEGRLSHVSIAIISAEATFQHTAPVEDGLEPAVGHALGEAVARALMGPGVWLAVEGGLVGGEVRVDGRVVGTVPWRGRVDAGTRDVAVSIGGRTLFAERVYLPDDLGTFVRVEAHRPEERVRQPSPWNYVVGGALLAGGGVLGAIGIVEWQSADACVQRDTHDRCRRDAFGARDKALLGVGAAALVGSVVVFAARPIRVRAHVDGDGASLELDGTF